MCVNLSNNLHICVYIGSAIKKICNQFFRQIEDIFCVLEKQLLRSINSNILPKSMVFNHISLYIKKEARRRRRKKIFFKKKKISHIL